MFSSLLERWNDFFSRHSFLFVLLFLFFSSGYFIFTEFFYFGNVQFFVSQEESTLRIEKKAEIFCEQKQCAHKITPGTYRFSITKDGFSPFLGEFTVKMGNTTEVKIILERKSVYFEETKNVNNSEIQDKKVSLLRDSDGNLFHKYLDFSPKSINSSWENTDQRFSFSENTLSWNGTPLGKFPKLLQISSDEVGRGFWLVSENVVQQFSPRFEELSMHLRQNISSFTSLPDGSFLVKTQDEKIVWKPFSQQPKILAIRPLSLASVCKTDKLFLFLEETASEVALFSLNPYDEKSLKNIAVLEGLPKDSVHSIECTAEKKILLHLYDNESKIIVY